MANYNLTITPGMYVRDAQAKCNSAVIARALESYDKNHNGIFEKNEATEANKALKENKSEFNVDRKKRNWQTTGSIAAGAVVGAAVGSAVPVVGNAAGAVVGGVIGGIIDFFMD